MGSGAIVAAAAAGGAVARRAFDNLIYKFRAADATAADRARSLSDLGIDRSSLLAELEEAEVIKPGRDATQRYLDERTLQAYLTRRRRWVSAMAIAGIAMLLALGIVGFFLTGRR